VEAGLTVPRSAKGAVADAFISWRLFHNTTGMCENLVVFKDQCMEGTKEKLYEEAP
jgi:hypothetical protein